MVTINASHPSGLHLAAAPIRALGDLLVRMAEVTRYARALDLLNTTSDEDLRARETTRDAEIRRILGPCLHL